MPKNKVHIATYQEAAKPLANHIPQFEQSVVVRLGGKMPYADYDVHINSAKSIENSINKLAQKQLLIAGKIETLPLLPINKPQYPCVLKGIVRSCGTKVIVANDKDEFAKAAAKLKHEYYIEPLFLATSEYRFHCTRDEVFFEVKKIKRNPADIIVNHDNHFNKREFLKPRLYKQIHASCLRAMEVLDLDIACFDVMYSSKNNDKHEFVIAEANTNPELLANTFNAYAEALTKLITKRCAEFKQPIRAAVIPPLPQLEVKQPEPKMRLRNRILTDAEKMKIINDITNNQYLVDADNGFVNFKL